PDVRFPQATTYQVEVPAGTKSLMWRGAGSAGPAGATGGVLKDAVKFSFETPAPTLVSEWPVNGPTHLDVPMFAMFDQKIDRAAVLASVQVTSNGETFPVELL